MIPRAQAFWSGEPAHPPITDNLVLQAEATLHVSLPREFISLLESQNGGYTKGFAYPMTLRTSWAPDHVPLPWMAGIATGATADDMNILQSAYMIKEWNLPPEQVLIFGEGAYWLTLDYRGGAAPSIAWIDVDCAEDIQISPSFAAFVADLVPASVYE